MWSRSHTPGGQGRDVRGCTLRVELAVLDPLLDSTFLRLEGIHTDVAEVSIRRHLVAEDGDRLTVEVPVSAFWSGDRRRPGYTVDLTEW